MSGNGESRAGDAVHSGMTSETAAMYAAYAARDARFDGVFYIGVTSTGIYCRPVCTARTPKPANCRFFDSAEAAEKSCFRPCLRCRPELAPGNAPVDDARRIASLIVHRMNEGLLRDGGLERLAVQLGWSSRQVRRIVQRELGVSPMELVQTRRLLLAKQLLSETRLPVTEVALASGFASLRRFNDAFSRRYGMPPTRLRRRMAEGDDTLRERDSRTLRLAYRPPFDWDGMLRFLGARAMAGVEQVDDGEYRRTVQVGPHRGWIRVRHEAHARALLVDMPNALMPVLPAVLGRIRHLFDLDARPDLINAHLAADPLLEGAVARNPGLRVPGAFDGFELAVRAILGQQVSVKAATTFGGRFAAAFGEPAATPFDGLARTCPAPERIAGLADGAFAGIGITAARARTIRTLAGEIAAGRLRLQPGGHPAEVMARLVALPGIGPWTAHYVAMRALRWPDAFPREDMVLRRRLGDVTAAEAEARSAPWRPWRSYATLHLWNGAAAE